MVGEKEFEEGAKGRRKGAPTFLCVPYYSPVFKEFRMGGVREPLDPPPIYALKQNNNEVSAKHQKLKTKTKENGTEKGQRAPLFVSSNKCSAPLRLY